MTVNVDEKLNGKTVLEILKGELDFSSSLITFLKQRDRGIVLNGERVTVRKAVKTGDVLELEYLDEKTVAEESDILPVNIPIDIIYEDSDIIVVNKSGHMPTHPSHNHQKDTLANALRFYFDSKDVPFIFRAVNRLDNNTSGIVLIAKNRLAAAKLSREISDRRIHKSYLAVLNGCPSPEMGEICAPIKRSEGSIITREIHEDGAYSLTKYRTIYSNDMFSLVEAAPITGRTHQLRLHFSHVGHPICGDTLYGYPSRYISRQALHAYRISFTHPTTQKVMTVYAKPPKDFVKLLTESFGTPNFDLERILSNAPKYHSGTTQTN